MTEASGLSFRSPEIIVDGEDAAMETNETNAEARAEAEAEAKATADAEETSTNQPRSSQPRRTFLHQANVPRPRLGVNFRRLDGTGQTRQAAT